MAHTAVTVLVVVTVTVAWLHAPELPPVTAVLVEAPVCVMVSVLVGKTVVVTLVAVPELAVAVSV